MSLYKVHEEKMFKGFHKTAMADSGVPSLKKRGVYVPGHSEVMEFDEREALYGSQNSVRSRIVSERSKAMLSQVSDNLNKRVT